MPAVRPRATHPREFLVEPATPEVDGAIVVVGAGIAGLAAAYRLRQAGLPVVVLERTRQAGGRMATVERAGFHIDLDSLASLTCSSGCAPTPTRFPPSSRTASSSAPPPPTSSAPPPARSPCTTRGFRRAPSSCWSRPPPTRTWPNSATTSPSDTASTAASAPSSPAPKPAPRSKRSSSATGESPSPRPRRPSPSTLTLLIPSYPNLPVHLERET